MKIKCISSVGVNDLVTLGKVYEAEEVEIEEDGVTEEWYRILAGDDGGIVMVFRDRFEVVKEAKP